MEGHDSFWGSIFLMDSSLGKYPHCGESSKAEYKHCWLVLYVQTWWVDHRPVVTSLCLSMTYGLWCFVFLECSGSCRGGWWSCWKGGFGRHYVADMWGAMPHCVMWRQKNRTFNGVERSSVELKMSLLRAKFDWLAALSGHSFSSRNFQVYVILLYPNYSAYVLGVLFSYSFYFQWSITTYKKKKNRNILRDFFSL